MVLFSGLVAVEPNPGIGQNVLYTQQVARRALCHFEDALSLEGVPMVGQCASTRSLRYGVSTVCGESLAGPAAEAAAA